MKTRAAIVIMILKWSVLFSQNSIDIFTLSGQFGNPDNSGENIFNTNLKLPVRFTNRSIWYNDINYFNYRITSYNTLDPSLDNSLNLHGIILQSGLIQRINKNQSVYLLFVPRLMSDLRNANGDDFQFGGILLFENKFHEDLTMRFGASYNQDLFGPYIVPMVYVYWNALGRLNISGMLPIYSKISYLVNDKLTIGIHHLGMVTSYNLNNKADSHYYIESNRIELNLFSRYKISKNIHTELRAGYTVGRSYTQYQIDDKIEIGFPILYVGDNRAPLDHNIKKGMIYHIRLVYNLPLTK